MFCSYAELEAFLNVLQEWLASQEHASFYET